MTDDLDVTTSAGFTAALAPHLTSIYRFAASLTSATDAGDLVQDSLARAWQRRSAFRPDRGPILGWVLAIVADQAGRQWRRRRDPVTMCSLGPPSYDDPDISQTTDIRRAIMALPPRQRIAIVLRRYVDLELSDIALVMKCSIGTVKSTLHDARRALAAQLGQTYATH